MYVIPQSKPMKKKKKKKFNPTRQPSDLDVVGRL